MVDAGFTFKFLEVRALDLVGHAVGAPHSDVPRAVEVPEPTAAAALQKVFAALMMKQIVVASLRHPVRADTVNFGPVRWNGQRTQFSATCSLSFRASTCVLHEQETSMVASRVAFLQRRVMGSIDAELKSAGWTDIEEMQRMTGVCLLKFVASAKRGREQGSQQNSVFFRPSNVPFYWKFSKLVSMSAGRT